jgi:hypothetical protein
MRGKSKTCRAVLLFTGSLDPIILAVTDREVSSYRQPGKSETCRASEWQSQEMLGLMPYNSIRDFSEVTRSLIMLTRKVSKERINENSYTHIPLCIYS